MMLDEIGSGSVEADAGVAAGGGIGVADDAIEEDDAGANDAVEADDASSEEAFGADGSVNTDEAPIVELVVDGVAYRVDAGHGSAVAISKRAEGSWAWRTVTEGRFDGTRLRAPALSHAIREALGRELIVAQRNQADE
jgi:hypothetical protein